MDRAFQRKLEELAYNRSLYEVWDDFITLSAVTIANAVCFQQEREEVGKRIIMKYGKQGMEGMKELLVMTVEALESNPRQDYLGTMYMEFGFENPYIGQHFTPYALAELNAMDCLTDEKVYPYVAIGDCCCGSGVMLIAAFNRIKQMKMNPHTQLFCVGQDVNFETAMMCYVQISLLGIAGYVVVGDSLKESMDGSVLIAPEDAWCTPLYFLKTWTHRRVSEYLKGM